MKSILAWVLLLPSLVEPVFAAVTSVINLSPAISGTPTTSVIANATYRFLPSASDPEGAKLTFSIAKKPLWASFNTTTGELVGTPTGSQAASYSGIVITVSDGKLKSSLSPFSIQVNNPAPTISGTSVTSVQANSAYSFTPTASDPNNDKLTFSILKKPVWATLNTKTGALTGKPTSAQAGIYKDILIAVSDGKTKVNLPAFSIQVDNPAPIISGTPTTSIVTNTAYRFTPTATDPNGDRLTFSITNKPVWATFSTTTGVLTGTPLAKHLGVTKGVNIAVMDGKTKVSLPAFDLQVSAPVTNKVPVISGTPVTSTKMGDVYTFTPTAVDEDKTDTLIFSIANKPSWATFDTATGKLSGTPSVAGEHDGITISVTDSKSTPVALPVFKLTVVDPLASLTLDTDGDGKPNVTDTDDDNDGVLDNDDFRPLDNTVTVIPSYTGRVNAYEQTYVRQDKSTTNYSSDSFVLLRSISGSFATAGLLYFDIPATLNGKRLDSVSEVKLTVKSDTEQDDINIFTATAAGFPTAASATWNNASPLFGNTLYGSANATAGASTSLALTLKPSAGKVVFVVDETGNTSREKLIKSNTETYLDLKYQEVDPALVNIAPVASSRATQAGGELTYTVTLAQAPTKDVYLSLVLQNTSTANITSATTLTFTPSNYNVPQTVVIKGKDDGSHQGTKANKLLVYPLNSEDASFNGVNPSDWDFNVYAALPAANTGEAYRHTVDFSAADAKFALANAPIGMSINAKTGVITWQPDSAEAGNYDFSIIAKQGASTVFNKVVSLQVQQVGANPLNALYVVPAGTITNPIGTVGSSTNPYTSIEIALTAATNDSSKRTIYVRGGRYPNTAITVGNVDGAEGNPSVITRLPGERVTFEFSSLSAFEVSKEASHLVIDGFEIDGKAIQDHWDMLANHWWDPLGDRSIGGGQAFNVDGQYITIKNNVIHDVYQKGVNIYRGRYVNVHGNVVYNVGHSSLSGGHGIMRKWERNFHVNPTADNVDGSNDDLGLDVYTASHPYRFDITGNLLLRVEQRIYSRVFNKGYSLLAIDEGKPMAFDETQDTDPKSRVSHNLVLYGGIDHIRLKQNPNMEVYNNSVLPDLTRTDIALDGITDKTKLKNLKFYGNLVASNDLAIDVLDSFGTVDNDEAPIATRKYDNYIAGGGLFTGGLGDGITNLGGTDASPLFVDPTNGNFNSVLGAGVGVGAAHLSHLMALVNEYALELKPSGWIHNHLRNAETLVANIPSTVFDTSTYYIGASSIEGGHQALYLKFIDRDGQWLYNKLETGGGSWGSLLNSDLASSSIYDLSAVKIQKCDNCTGAYVFQLVLPHEWFDHYGNAAKTPFTVTNVNGTTSNVVYLNPLGNTEHKAILDYSAAGKVRSYP